MQIKPAIRLTEKTKTKKKTCQSSKPVLNNCMNNFTLSVDIVIIIMMTVTHAVKQGKFFNLNTFQTRHIIITLTFKGNLPDQSGSASG